MCFPYWDSPAIFSELIGGSGSFAITPRARYVWGGYYEDGTLIWRSRWVTDDDAIVECREALALPGRRDCAVVLRRILACRGEARVRLLLNPRAEFGKEPARDVRRDEAGNWRGVAGNVHFVLAGAADGSAEDGTLVLDLTVAENGSHDVVLALATSANWLTPPDPGAAWSETEARWREKVPALDLSVGRRDARHSQAVLAGMTGADGGMVAAATTSLPERAREGRNYDYRYVWLRDQCFAGQAAARAGSFPLLDEYVRFVAARLLEHGAALPPAYTSRGGRVPDERRLDLPGYPGGDDVVGNRVNGQFQLDAFGEALLLFAAAARHDRLDAETWDAAEIAAKAIEDRWREPDAGIWELEPNEWAHSRLICAAGLRAIGSGGQARRPALADALVADTAARSTHPSGRWQRAPNDPRLDAALLFPAIRGAVAADDPRSVATLAACDQELTEDGFIYRYQPDARPLGESEGAFLLCGFAMSLAHLQRGDRISAARWFERNRTACGPPGLLSEEFDVTQRQLRGNIPQAFVHALLLESAAAQSED